MANLSEKRIFFIHTSNTNTLLNLDIFYNISVNILYRKYIQYTDTSISLALQLSWFSEK